VRTLRRGEEAELAPKPRIEDLTTLAHVDGPRVEVEIEGDVATLPASVSSTVYSLAQESITNARRHARKATRVGVSVAVDETSVRLSVRDDGELARARPSAPGYGLIGMAERAELLGGTLKAGPNPEIGWTVTAVLPRHGGAA
jgi:signal transduction histidine kinase